MEAPSLESIHAARRRIAGLACRTPLIRLQHDGPQEIHLKLEQLQPVGSFKIRCAANALLARDDRVVRSGVVTASAGNFAQGLGYVARRLGIRVRAIVPDNAADSKLAALRRYGVAIDRRPREEWAGILEDPVGNGFGEEFIHPCADPDVMAGNGTIGLEILEELSPALVLAPYGGGGLAVGVAAALKASRSSARILATESDAGTPVAAAFDAGTPVTVPFDGGTFITGMGSARVLAPMWPLVRALVDGACRVSLEAVAGAIRLLVDRHHVVAEGAGAAPVAAALSSPAVDGPIVCIVSGGHLDRRHLLSILGPEAA